MGPIPGQGAVVAVQPQHRPLLRVEQAQAVPLHLQLQQRLEPGLAQQGRQPLPEGPERDARNVPGACAGEGQDVGRLGLPQVAQYQPMGALLLFLPQQQPVAIELQLRPVEEAHPQVAGGLALHGEALHQGIGDLRGRHLGRRMKMGGKGRHDRIPIGSRACYSEHYGSSLA
jgi:hypothetical protein